MDTVTGFHTGFLGGGGGGGGGNPGRPSLCIKRGTSIFTIPSFPGRNGLATYASSNFYFHCQRVGRTNQISSCHMTTVNQTASCVETSQSCPFIDRLIALQFALAEVARPFLLHGLGMRLYLQVSGEIRLCLGIRERGSILH